MAVETIAILADKLECCTINNIMSHTGLSTNRWGYVAFSNQNKFYLCDVYFPERLRTLSSCSISTYRRCGVWNYNSTSSYGNTTISGGYFTCRHLKIPQPSKGREVIGQRTLVPIKQTFLYYLQLAYIVHSIIFTKCGLN